MGVVAEQSERAGRDAVRHLREGGVLHDPRDTFPHADFRTWGEFVWWNLAEPGADDRAAFERGLLRAYEESHERECA